MAVGAAGEDSNTTRINGHQTDNSLTGVGAVYVFTRSGTTESQQAYVKASNTGVGDAFGYSVSLSSDNNTLAVAAMEEPSSAAGVNGGQSIHGSDGARAVYVY